MPRSNLEHKVGELQQLVDTIPAGDWGLWKQSAPTKALLLQFEIDLEDLKDGWANGAFSDEKQVKAQAQSAYLTGIPRIVDSLVRNESEEEEYED